MLIKEAAYELGVKTAFEYFKVAMHPTQAWGHLMGPWGAAGSEALSDKGQGAGSAAKAFLGSGLGSIGGLLAGGGLGGLGAGALGSLLTGNPETLRALMTGGAGLGAVGGSIYGAGKGADAFRTKSPTENIKSRLGM